MIAITTNSSMRVNPRAADLRRKVNIFLAQSHGRRVCVFRPDECSSLDSPVLQNQTAVRSADATFNNSETRAAEAGRVTRQIAIRRKAGRET